MRTVKPDELLANTTNLAILPYVNFQPSGNAYNGMSYGRVPYAQGYGEINYIARNGARYALGATYYGNNNPYNNPAFGVMTGSIRYPVNRRSYLTLTGYNLTSAYDTAYYNLNGGIPVPLVNGQVGWAASVNVGPATYNLTYHLELGH